MKYMHVIYVLSSELRKKKCKICNMQAKRICLPSVLWFIVWKVIVFYFTFFSSLNLFYLRPMSSRVKLSFCFCKQRHVFLMHIFTFSFGAKINWNKRRKEWVISPLGTIKISTLLGFVFKRRILKNENGH